MSWVRDRAVDSAEALAELRHLQLEPSDLRPARRLLRRLRSLRFRNSRNRSLQNPIEKCFSKIVVFALANERANHRFCARRRARKRIRVVRGRRRARNRVSLICALHSAAFRFLRVVLHNVFLKTMRVHSFIILYAFQCLQIL